MTGMQIALLIFGASFVPLLGLFAVVIAFWAGGPFFGALSLVAQLIGWVVVVLIGDSIKYKHTK